jgi:hypothetical protein
LSFKINLKCNTHKQYLHAWVYTYLCMHVCERVRERERERERRLVFGSVTKFLNIYML